MTASVPARRAFSLAATCRRRGFTFIEILATMTLMAIVLPPVMEGISLCLSTASYARQESEAIALAHGKLAELTATGDWRNVVLSGDFGPDWPEYQWTGQLVDWAPTQTSIQQTATLPAGAALQQLDVTVSWTGRNRQRSVTLSTLVYTSAGSSTSNGMGLTGGVR